MKTVLLAGGFGTRISEETSLKPKPMVEIGGSPILVHIMRMYAGFGFKDFVVAGGYRVDYIKDYFINFAQREHDYRLDLGAGELELLGDKKVDWRIWVFDTGLSTMTGGRIRRLGPELREGTFMATYGDGLSDLDIAELVKFHRSHGKLATVTAVRPPARFGSLRLDGTQVVEFEEKNPLKEGWINGGFFVLEPGVLDYIDSDDQPFEKDPLSRLAADGELMAFQHDGFWAPMDTLRDKNNMEALWESGEAPWAR